MRTPHVPIKLQNTIRRKLADENWPAIAQELGITLKSLQYQLNPLLGRDVTFHFVGLLAAHYPHLFGDMIKAAK